jgi:aminoglycoside phosphotransferase (APT) family kinase protein
MPKTLVHGDFVAKNIRIKDRVGAPALLPFDWETAGHGAPAADVALCPDAHAYWLLVREAWPHIGMEDINVQVVVGRLFRVLASICWEAYSLAGRWAALEMKTMGYFAAELSGLIRILGWARGGAHP